MQSRASVSCSKPPGGRSRGFTVPPGRRCFLFPSSALGDMPAAPAGPLSRRHVPRVGERGAKQNAPWLDPLGHMLTNDWSLWKWTRLPVSQLGPTAGAKGWSHRSPKCVLRGSGAHEPEGNSRSLRKAPREGMVVADTHWLL